MKKYQDMLASALSAAENDLFRKRIELFDQVIIQPLVDGIEKYKEFKKIAEKELPKVTVPRITNPLPIIDHAALSSLDWSGALDMGPWSMAGGDPCTRDICSRIAYDANYLYVNLEERIDTKTLNASDQVWGGDDWELFFAKERKNPYRQLLISPTGKLKAIAYGENIPSWDVDAKIYSDTSSGDLWKVNIAIPLAQILPQPLKPGDVFYANFFRAASGNASLLAWNPTLLGSFHELSRMGEFKLEL